MSTVITPDSYMTNNVHKAMADQVMAEYGLHKNRVTQIELTGTEAIVQTMVRDDGKPRFVDGELVFVTQRFAWPA